MPAVGDFLARFRPAGAPGPAAGAVPADRRAELEAELQPVFALLTGPEAERRMLIEEADRTARRIREEAAASAALLVERARADAGTNRAKAAAEVRAAVRSEHDTLLAEAHREAGQSRRTAAETLPVLVAQAVASVRALAGTAEPGGETAEPAAGTPEAGDGAPAAAEGAPGTGEGASRADAGTPEAGGARTARDRTSGREPRPRGGPG